MKARILIIDDDEEIIGVLSEFFRSLRHEVLVAREGEPGWEMVRAQRPDLLVCNWFMPDRDGLEICRDLKADPRLRSIYTILIARKDRRPEKILALEAGADDFLCKPIEPLELTARVKVGLRMLEQQRNFRTTALTDALTGLGNRHAFQDVFAKEFERARRYATPLSLLVIRVERLKTADDGQSSDSSDNILHGVARIIARDFRRSDMAFRLGDESFAILLPEDREGAQVAAERIRGQFEQRLGEDNAPERPTIAFGLAMLQENDTPDSFLRRAETEASAERRQGAGADPVANL